MGEYQDINVLYREIIIDSKNKIIYKKEIYFDMNIVLKFLFYP
jgi:hypothetical protein